MKTKSLLYILTIIYITVNLSSCKKKDTYYEEAKTPEELLTAGKWNNLKVVNFENNGEQTTEHNIGLQLEFKNNGECFIHKNSLIVAEGNWQFNNENGKKIELSFYFNQCPEFNLVNGTLNVRTLNKQFFTFDVVISDVHNDTYLTKIFYFIH